MNPKLPAYVPALTQGTQLWDLTSPLDQQTLNLLLGNNATRSQRSLVAYAREWMDWCEAHQCSAFPADDRDVCRFLTDALLNRGLSAPSVSIRLTAINALHYANGYTRAPSGLIRALLRAARRRHRKRQATPFTSAQILACCDLAEMIRLPMRRLRDRALTLLAFASGLRPDELVRLTVGDLDIVPLGIVIHVYRAKTDRSGLGQIVKVGRTKTRYCPVAAMEEWLRMAQIGAGPLFRTVDRYDRVLDHAICSKQITRIAQGFATVLRLTGRYCGYSFRRGFATSAYNRHISEDIIQEQLRHKQRHTTRMYIDYEGVPFERNVTARVMS